MSTFAFHSLVFVEISSEGSSLIDTVSPQQGSQQYFPKALQYSIPILGLKSIGSHQGGASNYQWGL